LPLREIPAEIVRITRVRPVIAVSEDGEQLAADERYAVAESIRPGQCPTRRDFSRYKALDHCERIQRRMQLKQVESLAN